VNNDFHVHLFFCFALTLTPVHPSGGWRATVSVGVDEDVDQITTLLICVHQIFEINGSRRRRRSPVGNFV